MSISLIGLGANQGDRKAQLDRAVTEIGQLPQTSIVAVSAWRETVPIGGPTGQMPYLNGAVRLETSLEPQELLASLLAIEDRLGRRRTERWGARTIDLDLLLHGECVFATRILVLPHPRMAWRRFVLEPAAEIAPDMRHPAIGWTTAQLLEHLNTSRPYLAITGPIGAGKTRLAQRLTAAVSAQFIAEQPDWPSLDAFYTDPSGHAWQTELGFLRQRAHLLAKNDADRWGPQWAISDFWFDQSAAFAKAWLPEGQLPAYLKQYEQFRRDVVRPKLIVWLDAPAEELLARVHQRGRPCERHLTVGQLDRIRRAVQAQVEQPELGPVLRAGSDDADAVFAEVLAAVQGMG
jgi:2-amino-4-hydroxy-6-hydroxymethyldihydropteridine diphosphokinase